MPCLLFGPTCALVGSWGAFSVTIVVTMKTSKKPPSPTRGSPRAGGQQGSWIFLRPVWICFSLVVALLVTWNLLCLVVTNETTRGTLWQEVALLMPQSSDKSNNNSTTESASSSSSSSSLQLPYWIQPFVGAQFEAFRASIDEKITQHRAQVAAQMTHDTQICKFPLFKGGTYVIMYERRGFAAY